jgi:hypothetical protein
MLEQSKFAKKFNMQRAVDALRNQCYNETNWYRFLAQQMIQDNYRNEKWFDNLPVKHNIYRETLQIG